MIFFIPFYHVTLEYNKVWMVWRLWEKLSRIEKEVYYYICIDLTTPSYIGKFVRWISNPWVRVFWFCICFEICCHYSYGVHIQVFTNHYILQYGFIANWTTLPLRTNIIFLELIFFINFKVTLVCLIVWEQLVKCKGKGADTLNLQKYVM